MKNIFFWVFALLIDSSHLKASNQTAKADNENSIVVKRDCDFYQNKNVLGGQDTLFFRSELLSECTYDYWKKFCEYQKSRSVGDHRLSIGLAAFEGSLENYSQSNGKYSVHICFCSRMDLFEAIQWPEFSEIEMSLAVFSQPNCPITSHLGIMRGVDFYGYDKLPHKNISMLMHGFAAMTSMMRNPALQFMVTRPSLTMASIFKKHFAAQALPAGVINNQFSCPGVVSEAEEESPPPPIDDNANQKWRLRSGGATIDQEFYRPIWFPSLGSTLLTIKAWQNYFLLPDLSTQLISPNASAELQKVIRERLEQFQHENNGRLPEKEHIATVSIKALIDIFCADNS